MSRSQFTEVEVIRDPDGLVAIISERNKPRAGPVYSFAIMKEFERNGQTERTAFMGRRHVDGARRLLTAVEERLDQLEDRRRAAERGAML